MIGNIPRYVRPGEEDLDPNMPPRQNPKGWTPLKDLNNFIELMRLNDVESSDYQLTKKYVTKDEPRPMTTHELDRTLLDN